MSREIDVGITLSIRDLITMIRHILVAVGLNPLPMNENVWKNSPTKPPQHPWSTTGAPPEHRTT